MAKPRKRNILVVVFTGVLLAISGGLVSYSPTLYQIFCNLTGYGGTVRRATAPKPQKVAASQPVTVYFDANVDPGLPWEFEPEQRKVETRFGQPTKVYYDATNSSDETVIARAAFNVTPFKAAPYFFKIECFCFTEEKLGPGQHARMPLVFYVDRQLLKDPNTREVRDITLSYTFYRQTDLSAKEKAGARDLKKGSEETDARLKKTKTAQFENDARRR